MDKQLQQELDRWLRTLDFLKEEFVHLNHRLAEMVHLKADKHLLEQAEAFQDFFLNTDTIIAMLKKDIRKHQQSFVKDLRDNEALLQKVLKSHSMLRGDMKKLEKEFSRLNNDFNTFVTDFGMRQVD